MQNKGFLAFLVVSAIIVVGVVAWSGSRTQPNITVQDAVTNTNSATTSNSNVAVVDSNSDYTILDDATQEQVGEITTYRFAEKNILNVMPAEMQSLVLNETPVKQRESITVDGISGERLTISSAKDGSDVTIVQIVDGDTLYDFRGDDNFLTNISQYINFN